MVLGIECTHMYLVCWCGSRYCVAMLDRAMKLELFVWTILYSTFSSSFRDPCELIHISISFCVWIAHSRIRAHSILLRVRRLRWRWLISCVSRACLLINRLKMRRVQNKTMERRNMKNRNESSSPSPSPFGEYNKYKICHFLDAAPKCWFSHTIHVYLFGSLCFSLSSVPLVAVSSCNQRTPSPSASAAHHDTNEAILL